MSARLLVVATSLLFVVETTWLGQPEHLPTLPHFSKNLLRRPGGKGVTDMSPFILCRARIWTAIYQGPSFGFAYVWSKGPVPISWRVYSASPPWYSGGDATINGKTTILFGTPTPWVQLEVRPSFDAVLLAT